ncbi:MAG: hypothetical protein WCC11_07600 [Gammaproteobacteria bacterium]
MRQQNFRHATALTALVLALVMCCAWTRWYEVGSGSMRAAAPSVVPASAPVVTARWRYTLVPDDDMATIRHSYAALNVHYRKYQQAWRAYQKRLVHCQAIPPSVCALAESPERCGDQRMTQCLGGVVPALEAARNDVHDEAIELEEAAQQLANTSA